jgi:hypothetical protein
MATRRRHDMRAAIPAELICIGAKNINELIRELGEISRRVQHDA